MEVVGNWSVSGVNWLRLCGESKKLRNGAGVKLRLQRQAAERGEEDGDYGSAGFTRNLSHHFL